jgi:hypothetical protein
MRKGLIGAAAAAALLAATPSLAQPAPGSACNFVQTAVIETADHFENMKNGPGPAAGSYAVRPDLAPADATVCGISPWSGSKMIALCSWGKPSEAAARAFETKLTQEVATCLGAGRKPRPMSSGDGVIFANGPKYDIAAVQMEKSTDVQGVWIVSLMIVEDGETFH